MEQKIEGPLVVQKHELENNCYLLEVYLKTGQRVFVEVRTDDPLMPGLITKIDDTDLPVCAVIYHQIEDASNPFAAIFGILQTLEACSIEERLALLDSFEEDLNELRKKLVSRLEDLVERLEQGKLVFVGLDLDAFKTLLTKMMSTEPKVEAQRVAGPGGALVFKYQNYQSRLTQEEGLGIPFFFYYPHGAHPEVDPDSMPLKALHAEIQRLNSLDPQSFLTAIFKDLLITAKRFNEPVTKINQVNPRDLINQEETSVPRFYMDPKGFAINIYQKFYAIAYALHIVIKDHSPVTLAGGQSNQLEPEQLAVIREAIRRALTP
jgi:hypothetical protein